MRSTDEFHVLRRWLLRAKLCQSESIRKSKVLEATTDGSEEKTQTVTSNAVAAS